ncbi:hypothetical protein BOX15_Mlig011730g1 [Macrostomum lignano]|uniref:Erf4 domain-containing protein n=3 Tax=Macrostomum lignano TaxID=282301 RepID=A0A1I8IJW2_9PLAT|nr:hypothetical protein BOX15_Mlig004750g1 [Macrostomum lignano]PAA72177.1 hypothetical protein BOX15_Mlig011730g1 [Macrostomum lignano]
MTSNDVNLDAIDVVDEDDIDRVILDQLPQPDPIIIRGNGNVTLFGLNNRFCSDYPSELQGRVAPEEFKQTVERINAILRKTMPLNLKWYICGCFCCCCTLGCSLWPVVCLNKRTRSTIEKSLEWENQNLYHRLRLHWRLVRLRFDSSNMMEYVLELSFLPKPSIQFPD